MKEVMTPMQFQRRDGIVNTNGTPPEVGTKFPEFIIKNKNNQKLTLKQLLDKLTLISVVPDINTRVCSISTQRFNHEMDRYSQFNFYTISTNEPQDQQNWCAAEGVSNMELLSDSAFDFGKKAGLFIAANKTDARCIYILDTDGTILYRELINPQNNEPNYQAALEFLNSQA